MFYNYQEMQVRVDIKRLITCQTKLHFFGYSCCHNYTVINLLHISYRKIDYSHILINKKYARLTA